MIKMQSKTEIINAVFSAVCHAYGLTKTQILAKQDGTRQEMQEAFALITVLLKERGLSFGELALALKAPSRGAICTKHKAAVSWLKSGVYKDFSNNYAQISQKMPIAPENLVENLNKESEEVFENFDENTPENSENSTMDDIKPTVNTFNDVFEVDAQVLSPSESPLAEEVITRDRSNIFPKTNAEIEAISNGADPSDPFADFDNEKTEVFEQSTIPEMQLERNPSANGANDTNNGNRVIINEETADFTTTTILTVLETVSVEVCQHYSKIDEDQIRQLAEKKEIPKDSITTVQGINKTSYQTLKTTAHTHIQNVAASLKKVVMAKNIQTSPETALVLMLLIFAGMMYLATNEIKKNSADAIDRLRNVQTENTK